MSHSMARYFGTLAVLLLNVACGGGEDGRPQGVGPIDVEPQVEPTHKDPKPVGPACVEGTTRTCTIVLAKQGDVKNCFVGEQMCIDGAYSECYDPAHPPAAASKKDGSTDEPADDEPGADDDETDEPDDKATPDDDSSDDDSSDDDSSDDDSDDDDSDDDGSDDDGSDDDGSDDDDRGNDDSDS